MFLFPHEKESYHVKKVVWRLGHVFGVWLLKVLS